MSWRTATTSRFRGPAFACWRILRGDTRRTWDGKKVDDDLIPDVGLHSIATSAANGVYLIINSIEEVERRGGGSDWAEGCNHGGCASPHPLILIVLRLAASGGAGADPAPNRWLRLRSSSHLGQIRGGGGLLRPFVPWQQRLMAASQEGAAPLLPSPLTRRPPFCSPVSSRIQIWSSSRILVFASSSQIIGNLIDFFSGKLCKVVDFTFWNTRMASSGAFFIFSYPFWLFFWMNKSAETKQLITGQTVCFLHLQLVQWICLAIVILLEKKSILVLSCRPY